jgi:lipopolysaccharide biosynthesis glycosyltransferase
MADDKIHIATCCDDNYAPYVAVMILSVLRATTAKSRVCFHLVDSGIDAENIYKIKQVVSENGADIIVYPADHKISSGLPVLRYGLAVYQRINLPDYLQGNISRVIYLDSDTLVLGDLAELWDIDLNGNPLGAVENLSPTACNDIGIPREEYFNSGLLLMDLDIWRCEGIHHHITEFLHDNAKKLRFVDQCSLNALLHKRWFKLPLSWNQQSDIYGVLNKYQIGCGYSKEEIKQAILSPKIVHFIGTRKPWNRYCFHPFKRTYLSFLHATPWGFSGFRDDSAKCRFKYFMAWREHYKQWAREREILNSR